MGQSAQEYPGREDVCADRHSYGRTIYYGKVLGLEAAGYADAAMKTPMRADAIFDIRSISKVVTVFGALLLVGE